jgi:hypothetical protein
MVLTTVVMLLSTCKKTELSGVENSSLQIFGTKSIGYLKTIVPTDDGGFIVGSDKSIPQGKEIWIQKYNKSFDLEWERFLGGPNVYKLEKIFLQNNTNILVAGIVQDHGSGISATDEIYPKAYFHNLDSKGNTIKENTFFFKQPKGNIFSTGLSSAHFINDIAQNEAGEFIVAAMLHDSFDYPGKSLILKLDQNLNVTTYAYFWFEMPQNKQPYGNDVNAIFKSGDSYWCYWYSGYKHPQLSAQAGFFRIEDTQISGRDNYQEFYASPMPWPKFKSGRDIGTFEQIKLRIDAENLSYNNFFSDFIYQSIFNTTTKTMSSSIVQTGFKNLVSANSTFDGHFILSQADGLVYETNPDFSIIHSFVPKFRDLKSLNSHTIICKLFSGDYVYGFEIENTMYLVHLNNKGQLITHE